MKVWKYVRKPFFVDAVQVTIENLEDVAKWCDGVIREASPRSGQPRQKYVKVHVLRPLNEKQTMAFPGDFVLHAGADFKIYTAKAFFQTFDPAEDDHSYGQHLVEIDEAHKLPIEDRPGSKYERHGDALFLKPAHQRD